MTERTHDQKQIVAELTRSAHGDLSEYLPIGKTAVKHDPDFFAHLIAWNHLHGQIRDARIALPVIALAEGRHMPTLALGMAYLDNALAHIADLRPREFARVVLRTKRTVLAPTLKRPKAKSAVIVPPFAQTADAPMRVLRRLVTRYLRDLEADRRTFEYTAVQHRRTLHELYVHYHVERPSWVGQILFHGEKRQSKNFPPGIFDVIRHLHLQSPTEAAGQIVQYKIPFLVARGALGKKANEPDTVLALIKAMSPTELVTNTKHLEALGVKTNPALRAAFEQALGRAATSKKATLKTSVAAAMFADGEGLAGKLHALQEKQIDNLGGIEGDWLIAADKSGSMTHSINVAREIAAMLARSVKGKIYLVFFDQVPRFFDATGKTLEEIKVMTAGIVAGGGTWMHVPIQYILERNLSVDGIVYVSDGANHGPSVTPIYQKYCTQMGVDPTMYLYALPGETNVFTEECRRSGIDLQTFDLVGKTVDHYALPNLVQTMRVARYSLLDEILATPLRTLDEVLDKTTGQIVLPQLVHA